LQVSHEDHEDFVLDNVLQLQEVGDFEALNCLPAQNLIPSTTCPDSSGKLHLTTEPPILAGAVIASGSFFVRVFLNCHLIENFT